MTITFRCHALAVALALLAVLPAQGPRRDGPERPARAGVRVVDDLQYAEGISRDHRRNRLDLYLPAAGEGERKPPLLLFVHGGAWMGGDKNQYRGLGDAVAKAGIACAVNNYRLSPLVQHPAHVEDCARAFAFLHAKAGEHGYDPDRMFLMGHSAGGHLVALLCVDPSWLRAAGAPAGAVKGCIPLSGPMDVRPQLALFDGVFGREPEVRAQASPVLHVHEDQPPMYLFWAERDMAGLAEINRAMAARMKQVGAAHQARELPGEGHVSYLLRIGGARDVVLGPVREFVEKRCSELDRATAKTGASAAQPGTGR